MKTKTTMGYPLMLLRVSIVNRKISVCKGVTKGEPLHTLGRNMNPYT